MAANTGMSGGGSFTRYYGISDGMLTTNMSEVMDGFSEISLTELKQARDEQKSIDLRGKYLDRKKDKYTYRHYFQSIEGKILAIDSEDTPFGYQLKVLIEDKDGEQALISVKLYGSYSENLLNRLANTDLSKDVLLFPYSIPSDYIDEETKKKRTFTNMGIALKQGSDKIAPKYERESEDLPQLEKVKDPTDGKIKTSRVNRVDFLLDEVKAAFNKVAPSIVNSAGSEPDLDDEDALPF